MYRILALIAVFISVINNNPCLAQSSRTEIENYFTEALNGKTYFVSKSTLEGIDSKQFLKIATPFLKSDNTKVRYSAIDLIKRKGLLLSESPECSVYVELLIEACKDMDSGNSGAASKALTRYRKTDFGPSACDSLFSLLKLKPYHFERVIQLTGFIQPEKSDIYLREILLADSSLKKATSWAVNLALARMGDKESLRYCMEKVQSTPVSNHVVDYLMPDLLYTRQPEAIHFILNEILIDEKKCTSSNPDSETGIICAFKIMELIAPVVKNFPIPRNKYGELDMEDLDAALSTVREWINSKPVLEIDNNLY